MPRFKATTGLFVVIVSLLGISQLSNLRIKTSFHDEDSPPSAWNYAGVGLPSAQVDMAMVARNDSWRPKKIRAFNAYYEQVLADCAAGQPCAKNNDKVVLMPWGHFSNMIHGVLQGENVWCDSVVDALHALGYSMLIADGEDEFRRLWPIYHDRTKVILWNEPDARFCLQDPTCMAVDPMAPFNPPNATHLNVPLWKTVAMHWSPSVNHEFGGQFTMAPEDFSTWPNNGRQNFYLGYSLEKTCLRTPYVPPEERPRQVFVLAKQSKYFAPTGRYILRDHPQAAATFFSGLSERFNTSFVGAFHMDEGFPIPDGINRLARMSRPAFQATIARSRVLLGVGWPTLSPSPWEALCLGVPFINPIHDWDRKDPENRDKWLSQHDGLLHTNISEPYVFHVKQGDVKGFERATSIALNSSIPRYIPERMKLPALIERVESIVERDWLKLAQQQLLANGDD